MAYDPTDATTARYLLEQALAMTTRPTLDAAQVDALMMFAASTDAVTLGTVYTAASLDAAAAKGWEWKQGLVSDQYDLGGGAGKTLDRSQWFDHCMRMAAGYADGTFSVLGGGGNVAGSTSPKGIGVISLTSSLSREVGY